MRILIPQSPDRLNGPFITADDGFRVRGQREEAIILEFHERPSEIDWFDEFELLYCRQQHDAETAKVIRKATDEERALFRIPVWIQDDEVPECCGQEMQFVGQLDDDRLCAERPTGAKMWWHDAASFYVFTCPQCLKCAAVGQQY